MIVGHFCDFILFFILAYFFEIYIQRSDCRIIENNTFFRRINFKINEIPESCKYKCDNIVQNNNQQQYTEIRELLYHDTQLNISDKVGNQSRKEYRISDLFAFLFADSKAAVYADKSNAEHRKS